MSSLNDLYEKLGNEIISIEKTLDKSYHKRNKMQNAVLSMNDMNNINGEMTAFTCQKSPFRNVKFRFKPKPSIKSPLLDSLKNTPVRFTNLCSILIKYIEENQLFIDNGSIKCNELLTSLTNSNSTNFFTILKNIGQIIV